MSEHAVSLLGDTIIDTHAKRRWSDAYLVLTQASRAGRKENAAFRGRFDGRMVQWISSQSPPTPLPPYSSGAARSTLMTLLESGHGEVRLARPELDKIACWIDLLVPYCGDYPDANAWSKKEREQYEHFAKKRRRMEELDRQSVRELIEGK